MGTPNAFFSAFLPSLAGSAAQAPLGAMAGEQAGLDKALARQLQEYQLALEQQKLVQTKIPFWQEMKPGSVMQQVDPTTGQHIGEPKQTPLDELQQAHAEWYRSQKGKPILRTVQGVPMQLDPESGSFLAIPGAASMPLSKGQQVFAAKLFPGVPPQMIMKNPEMLQQIDDAMIAFTGKSEGAKATAREDVKVASPTMLSKEMFARAKELGFDPATLTPAQLKLIRQGLEASQVAVAGGKKQIAEDIEAASPRSVYDKQTIRVAQKLFGKNPLMPGQALTADELKQVEEHVQQQKIDIATAKPMTPDQAGRMTMMTQALANVNNAEQMLFPNGVLDRTLIGTATLGLPGSKGRALNVLLEDAISGKYRIETGAAGNKDEVASIARRFKPSLADNTETVRLKLAALRSFMESSIALSDPSQSRTMTGSEATKKYQRAVDDIFNKLGVPTTSTPPTPTRQTPKAPSQTLREQKMKEDWDELEGSLNPQTSKLYTKQEILDTMRQRRDAGRYNLPKGQQR